MQVSLLKLNSGISRAVETAATLERKNAELEAAIARLRATDRIRVAGARAGAWSLPPAGEVALRRRPARPTPSGAAQTMTPPTEAAHALLANGGVVPGSLAAGRRRHRDRHRGHDEHRWRHGDDPPRRPTPRRSPPAAPVDATRRDHDRRSDHRHDGAGPAAQE